MLTLTRLLEKQVVGIDKWRRFLSIIAIALLFASCASEVKKVDFGPSESSGQILGKVQSHYQEALGVDADILAHKDLEKGLHYLASAQKLQADGQSPEKVLDKLGYAEAYLDRAEKVATSPSRRGPVEKVLSARRAALNAGATDFADTRKTLWEYDKSLRNRLDDLIGEERNWGLLNNFAAQYLNLELATIQQHYLAQARADIAKVKGQAFRAPSSIAKAKENLSRAAMVIEVDRHNKELIKPYVQKANESANFAVRVVDIINNQAVSEPVAIELLKTKADNVVLSQNLKQAQQALVQEKVSLAGELEESKSKLGQLSSEQALQNALQASQREFAPSEAETFVQDGKLVVRLKQMNFPIGRSDLPASSLPALAKVRDVLKELNSTDVVVEGHTDSTGKRAFNKELSKERAATVATYFQGDIDGLNVTAIGVGESKPISSNETKQGRAQNRRVDVIITPGPGKALE